MVGVAVIATPVSTAPIELSRLAEPLAKTDLKVMFSPSVIVAEELESNVIVGAGTTSTSMLLVAVVPASLVTVKV